MVDTKVIRASEHTGFVTPEFMFINYILIRS